MQTNTKLIDSTIEIIPPVILYGEADTYRIRIGRMYKLTQVLAEFIYRGKKDTLSRRILSFNFSKEAKHPCQHVTP
jgi:hypothetical protein